MQLTTLGRNNYTVIFIIILSVSLKTVSLHCFRLVNSKKLQSV